MTEHDRQKEESGWQGPGHGGSQERFVHVRVDSRAGQEAEHSMAPVSILHGLDSGWSWALLVLATLLPNLVWQKVEMPKQLIGLATAG